MHGELCHHNYDLATTEAECMFEVEAGKELIWMRDFLSELGMKQEKLLLR